MESVGLDASVAAADVVSAVELVLVAATLLSTDKIEGHCTIHGSVDNPTSKVVLYEAWQIEHLFGRISVLMIQGRLHETHCVQAEG